METFTSNEGSKIVLDMIKAIQENKQYLSEIDGAIGDGDHGINMNKGFTLCEKELEKKHGDLAYSLETLSKILMTEIGGSMGPLYGMFFSSMARICSNVRVIDAELFAVMLKAGEDGIKIIGNADVGDKTMLDTLIPAVDTFMETIQKGESFLIALNHMKSAAITGRDSTMGMLAKVGRASRLGERSKGYLDAGACSCCLIICSMADSIIELIN